MNNMSIRSQPNIKVVPEGEQNVHASPQSMFGRNGSRQQSPSAWTPKMTNNSYPGMRPEEVRNKSDFRRNSTGNTTVPPQGMARPNEPGQGMVRTVESGQSRKSQWKPSMVNTSNASQSITASWRHPLQLLSATGNVGNGRSFSVDTDLVAFNVAKHITGEDLSNWLVKNGLNVRDCKLLTTSESARSLSYKITIDPKDYGRATKDVSLWPNGVSVRIFKHFDKNHMNNERRVKFQDGLSDQRNSRFDFY